MPDRATNHAYHVQREKTVGIFMVKNEKKKLMNIDDEKLTRRKVLERLRQYKYFFVKLMIENEAVFIIQYKLCY